MKEENQPLASSPSSFLSKGKLDLTGFSKHAFSSIVSLVKASNTFRDDYGDIQYCNTLPAFKQRAQQLRSRLLSLMQAVLVQYESADSCRFLDLNRMECESLKFDTILNTVDSLLEKANDQMDAFLGVTPAVCPVNLDQNGLTKFHISPAKFSVPKNLEIFHSKNILRPQLKFNETIDNSPATLWIPKISSKPNAIQPLPAYANLLKTSHPSELQYGLPHPYEPELKSLKPSHHWTERKEEILANSLQDTPFCFVQDEKELTSMVCHLRECSEIAVDLEHHDYRTFQGITCLMQISTRKRDFIVDTISLRSHLQSLNEIFTDPNTLKVFHGADSDVLWLQRDFGLYLVNMFDTGQASRALEYPSASLAYLLKYFCDVDANKKYQLADWRIRPLPEELVKYAREDTHYLLYIYDRLRNLLLEQGNSSMNLIQSTFTKSLSLCLSTYSKPSLAENSFFEFCGKFKKAFTPEQTTVCRALYLWRDRIAREEDESVRYVMPNHILFKISEIIPITESDLFECCNPIPTLVRVYSTDICALIKSARNGSSPSSMKPTMSITASSPLPKTYPSPHPSSISCPQQMDSIPTQSSRDSSHTTKDAPTPSSSSPSPKRKFHSKSAKIVSQSSLMFDDVKSANQPSQVAFKFERVLKKIQDSVISASSFSDFPSSALVENSQPNECIMSEPPNILKDEQNPAEFEKQVTYQLSEMKKSKRNEAETPSLVEEISTTAAASSTAKSPSQISSEPFVPYDFSNSKEIFSSNHVSEEPLKKYNSKRKFQPCDQIEEPKIQKAPVIKLGSKSGQRSFTYKMDSKSSSKQPHDSSSSSSLKWPSR